MITIKRSEEVLLGISCILEIPALDESKAELTVDLLTS